MENENNEISLLEIWNKIWKNKFLIIIITAVVVVLGTLLLYFSNRSGRVVTNKFNYSFLNIEKNKYPDGSFFDYQELFDEEFITTIKENNVKYENLNIKDLLNDKNTNITMIVNKDDASKNYLQISLPVKHFNNDVELSKDFINLIHDEVLETAKNKINTLGMYNYFDPETYSTLGTFKQLKDLTYLELLSLITDQTTAIKFSFEDFNAHFPNPVLKDQQTRLIDVYSDYDNWFKLELRIGLIQSEIINNNYFMNLERTINQSKLTYNRNKIQIDLYTKNRDELVAIRDESLTSGGIIIDESLNLEIIRLNTLIAKLEQDNSYYKYFHDKDLSYEETNPVEAKAFKDSFIQKIAELEDYVLEFNDFFRQYLKEQVRLVKVQTIQFEVTSPYNMVLMIIVLGLVGGIGGVTVSLIKESGEKNELVLEDN